MNAKQFFDKVVEMRKMQKEYFGTRSTKALTRSKILEHEIDVEIDRVQRVLANEKKEAVQGELFGQELPGHN